MKGKTFHKNSMDKTIHFWNIYTKEKERKCNEREEEKVEVDLRFHYCIQNAWLKWNETGASLNVECVLCFKRLFLAPSRTPPFALAHNFSTHFFCHFTKVSASTVWPSTFACNLEELKKWNSFVDLVCPNRSWAYYYYYSSYYT